MHRVRYYFCYPQFFVSCYFCYSTLSEIIFYRTHSDVTTRMSTAIYPFHRVLTYIAFLHEKSLSMSSKQSYCFAHTTTTGLMAFTEANPFSYVQYNFILAKKWFVVSVGSTVVHILNTHLKYLIVLCW